MGFISKTLKKGFFWSYPRTSWQWDVLCVLILVFIFMTPKTWFQSSGFPRSRAGQNARQVMLLAADVPGSQGDKTEIERRVRLLSGHPQAQVTKVTEIRDPSGALLGYEVDINY